MMKNHGLTLSLVVLLVAGCSAPPRPTPPVPPLAPAAPTIPVPPTAPVSSAPLATVESTTPEWGITIFRLDLSDSYFDGITATLIPLGDYTHHLDRDGGISVKVVDPEGKYLENAPVIFETSKRDSLTANPYGEGRTQKLTIRTNLRGIATAYLRPALGPPATSTERK